MTDDEVVEHGRLLEQHRGLERARHAQPSDRVRRLAGQILALVLDHAFGGRHRARDEIEERGLAGAVGPDDGVDLIGAEFDAHIVDRRQTAEALGEIADIKHCCAPP